MAETSDGGTTFIGYIWLNDVIVAGLKTNTPRVLTDQAQAIRWRWDNDEPFGANAANINPGGLGPIALNLRFPGQYFDSETNNHYNYFRDYSPEIGRYIESDPIGLTGGLNTYAYVYKNPVRFSDADGLRINWNNYILNNPWVVSNFIGLNQQLVSLGVPDECFELQVTGGDRYRQNRRIHRSLSNNTVVPGSDPNSPHLVERGSRAVDFKVIMSTDPKCTCYNISNSVLSGAIGNTSFDPNSTISNYSDNHIHINLPNTWNFWNINEP